MSEKWFDSKNQRKKATKYYNENEDGSNFHVVKYHATEVVKFNSDKIILNTGGWQSKTTKTRMNETSRNYDLGYSVSQEKYKWYVHYKNKKIPFEGDTLTLNR